MYMLILDHFGFCIVPTTPKPKIWIMRATNWRTEITNKQATKYKCSDNSSKNFVPGTYKYKRHRVSDKKKPST